MKTHPRSLDTTKDKLLIGENGRLFHVLFIHVEMNVGRDFGFYCASSSLRVTYQIHSKVLFPTCEPHAQIATRFRRAGYSSARK